MLQKGKELFTIKNDSQCCAFDSQMRNESNDIRSLFTEAKPLGKLKCLSNHSNLDEVTISSEHASHLIQVNFTTLWHGWLLMKMKKPNKMGAYLEVKKR